MAHHYIGIDFDRGHLEDIYQIQIFSSFNNYLDTLDTVVLFVNMFILSIICCYFLFKKLNQPEVKTIKLDQIPKNNEIPYFITLKHNKKGKGRDTNNKEKEYKDLNHIQMRCQKCKYITEIAQKNLITHQ